IPGIRPHRGGEGSPSAARSSAAALVGSRPRGRGGILQSRAESILRRATASRNCPGTHAARHFAGADACSMRAIRERPAQHICLCGVGESPAPGSRSGEPAAAGGRRVPRPAADAVACRDSSLRSTNAGRRRRPASGSECLASTILQHHRAPRTGGRWKTRRVAVWKRPAFGRSAGSWSSGAQGSRRPEIRQADRPDARPAWRRGAMTDIWIAGLGLQTVSQVTREVELAIRSSREVLYLDTGVATRSFLEPLCPRITSLYEESYSEEGPRGNAYEHMAARVIDAALDHPPIMFAIHGHPLVAAHPPFLILELANALDIRVTVLPGISAIDAIVADLRIDPVVHGVQMYEATDLLLRRRPLQSEVPAIIWQI